MPSIRHATIADIPLIRQLCMQVWPQTYAPILPAAQIDYMLEWMYSPASLAKQLQEGVTYLLCHDDTEPVGFAAYTVNGNDKFKLEKLYVLPNQQGKGTGRFIIDQVVALIVPQGAKTLQLQVNKQNVARHFYEKLGFTIASAAVFDIGHGYVMDDYVMELQLSRQNDLR